MAEVTPAVKTCSDLANDLTGNWNIHYHVLYDETHFVFDTYREGSLKFSIVRKELATHNQSNTRSVIQRTLETLL